MIESSRHLLSELGKRHYLAPEEVDGLAPVHPRQSGTFNAAEVMLKERPLHLDQVDLVNALLMKVASLKQALDDQTIVIRIQGERLREAHAASTNQGAAT